MAEVPTEDAASYSDAPPYRRPVNLRSVLLGLLGVVFICGLTAYNDHVVANTFLVGNFLPIGLILFFLVISLVRSSMGFSYHAVMLLPS